MAETLQSPSSNSELPSASALRTYTWGTDLSGAMQGAGGVGGLLGISLSTINSQPSTSRSYAACSDANGNVMGLINSSTGNLAARWDYDAFGNTVTDWAAESGDICPFRFSTKYMDAETGWYYYGFRYYAPELGRWVSRDPIGISGGVNLYGMVRNNPVNSVDCLGLNPITDGEKQAGHQKLLQLESKMHALCDSCCGGGSCKPDASRITRQIVATWDQNYGTGYRKGNDPIGGWMCWDWARAFQSAADSVHSKVWSTDVKHWWDNNRPDSYTVHYALKLSACCKDEGCSLFVDDGWGSPGNNEYVYPPPWPEDKPPVKPTNRTGGIPISPPEGGDPPLPPGHHPLEQWPQIQPALEPQLRPPTEPSLPPGFPK